MTDIPVTNLTYTIFVGKKLSDGDYGSDEVGIHVQADVPAGTDPTSDEAQLIIRNAANAAKAQVAVALGIETELDDEGTLQYKAAPARTPAPKAAPRDAAASLTAGAEVNGVSAEPPHIDPPKNSPEEKANSAWAKQRFAVAPNEFFDDRAQRAAEGSPRPNIKHRQYNRAKAGWQRDLVGWAD